MQRIPGLHDDVIKLKHLPLYWPFARGIHGSPVNSPYKGQWRAFMFSLICIWKDVWVNNREAGDWRHHRAHYDVRVMVRMMEESVVPVRLQCYQVHSCANAITTTSLITPRKHKVCTFWRQSVVVIIGRETWCTVSLWYPLDKIWLQAQL